MKRTFQPSNRKRKRADFRCDSGGYSGLGAYRRGNFVTESDLCGGQ